MALQYNDIQHNGTQLNVTLSIPMLCHNAESRVLCIMMLIVIMLSVVILNIMAQGINTLAYFGET
jgi:hypothetical protein